MKDILKTKNTTTYSFECHALHPMKIKIYKRKYLEIKLGILYGVFIVENIELVFKLDQGPILQ